MAGLGYYRRLASKSTTPNWISPSSMPRNRKPHAGATRLTGSLLPIYRYAPARRRSKNSMVCLAVEDRDLPQDPEVGLQSRRIETTNRRAARQLDRGPLYYPLPSFLDSPHQPPRPPPS